MKEKGFKFTEQRQTILDIMAENSGKHLSAEEIYGLVKEKNGRIGLATVYRTLLLMERLGIVAKLNKKG
jgi:Fur family ferric uptake transcriptional regulator